MKKLKKVSAQKFLDQLKIYIQEYKKECDRGIPTCDVQDVFQWINKTVKKVTGAMITKDNFKELVQTISPKELEEVLDDHHVYIKMESHVFNTGFFASVESINYNASEEKEAQDSGDLFCDKDDFRRLLDETEALEY